MKWSTYVILIILILPITVVADSNSRPDYSFSDSVFQELPAFPTDFWEIERLYATQSITAEQLGEAYYQPELLPGWEYWADRAYSNNSKSFGSYGIFFYPSHFIVSNIQKGDIFDISALIYTNWGIQKYQGVEICITSPEYIDVELIEPENYNILLSPTSPQFLPNWMQLIKIRIHVNEEKNAYINITEKSPAEAYEKQWEETYQSDYTSGSSLISQKISKCRIELIVPEKEESLAGVANADVNNGFPWVGILFVTIMLLFLVIATWKIHEKRKED